MIVEFKDGHKIEIWSPTTEIYGIMYGERCFNFYDSLKVKDPTNSLYCEIVFNPDRKSGVKGLISSFSASYLYSRSGSSELERADYIEGVISTKERIEYAKNRKLLKKGKDYLCIVSGHWTQDLYIDSELYWHIDDFRGFALRPYTDLGSLLLSDCRFREDLVELKRGDEENS